VLTSNAAVVNPKIVKFWMSRANPAMNSIPECQVPSPSTVRFRSVTTSLDPAPMTIPLIPGRTRSEATPDPTSILIDLVILTAREPPGSTHV